jgi:hypothetical protein
MKLNQHPDVISYQSNGIEVEALHEVFNSEVECESCSKRGVYVLKDSDGSQGRPYIGLCLEHLAMQSESIFFVVD